MTLSMSSRYASDRSVVLALSGELDYAGAPELRTAISAAADHDPRPSRIVVDLRGVTSIDHVGVGTLVIGTRVCREVGIDLAISSPSPLIRCLLELPESSRHDAPNPTGSAAARTDNRMRSGEWIHVHARAG